MSQFGRLGSLVGGFTVVVTGVLTAGIGIVGVAGGPLWYGVLIVFGGLLVPVGWYGLVAGVDPAATLPGTTDPVEPESSAVQTAPVVPVSSAVEANSSPDGSESPAEPGASTAESESSPAESESSAVESESSPAESESSLAESESSTVESEIPPVEPKSSPAEPEPSPTEPGVGPDHQSQ